MTLRLLIGLAVNAEGPAQQECCCMPVLYIFLHATAGHRVMPKRVPYLFLPNALQI